MLSDFSNRLSQKVVSFVVFVPVSVSFFFAWAVMTVIRWFSFILIDELSWFFGALVEFLVWGGFCADCKLEKYGSRSKLFSRFYAKFDFDLIRCYDIQMRADLSKTCVSKLPVEQENEEKEDSAALLSLKR